MSSQEKRRGAGKAQGVMEAMTERAAGLLTKSAAGYRPGSKQRYPGSEWKLPPG